MGRRLRAAPRAVPLAPLLSAEETRPRRRNRCHSRRAGVISRNSNSSGGEERKNWVLTIERAKGNKRGKIGEIKWMDGWNGGRKREHEFLFSWRNRKPGLESLRPLAPALRERYCKSNRIACQSGSSRFAAKKNARWNEVCALERGLNSRATSNTVFSVSHLRKQSQPVTPSPINLR